MTKQWKQGFLRCVESGYADAHTWSWADQDLPPVLGIPPASLIRPSQVASVEACLTTFLDDELCDFFDQFDSPHLLTAYDIFDCACAHLQGRPEHFEPAYEVFVSKLCRLATDWQNFHSTELRLLARPIIPFARKPAAMEQDAEVFSFRSDRLEIALRIVGKYSLKTPSATEYKRCLADVNVRGSKAATSEVFDSLRSVLVVVSQLLDPWKIESFVRNSATRSSFREAVSSAIEAVILSDNVIIWDAKLRNAVQLLSESFRPQATQIVRLMFAFAAIESLLGEKTDNLTQVLADRVAVLLEPRIAKREAAIKTVKKLYASRSGIAHGGKTEIEDEDVSRSQKLALAVLSSILLRRNELQKHRNSGLPVSKNDPQELFATLRSRLVQAKKLDNWPIFDRSLTFDWGG